MSKEKQFEHIENKIREAAQQNDYAFNEEAWSKMEVLLDKKDKKRRPILWLWLLPVMIGAAFLLSKTTGNKIDNNTSQIKSVAAEETQLKKNNNPVENKNEITEIGKKDASKVNVVKENSVSANSDVAAVKDKETKKINESSIDDRLTNIRTQKKRISSNKKSKTSVRITASNGEEDGKEILNDKLVNKQNKKPNQQSGVDETKEVTISSTPEILQKEIDDSITVQPVIAKIDSAKNKLVVNTVKDTVKVVAQNSSKNKTKKSNRFASKFYFLGSGGIDIGSVKLLSFNNSTTSFKYGIGVGYSFSKKLSVQTGFYIAEKKYAATAGYYKIKPGSYWDMPSVKLQNVEASCLVYDIPLSVRYDFGTKKSFTYYGMAGVSSYLMKREDYDYYYTKYGSPAKGSYSYRGNKHFMSNINLAAGIERKVSEKFALQLEPSISIPITGVGDGKVKLYSTSILFGVKYYPFKK